MTKRITSGNLSEQPAGMRAKISKALERDRQLIVHATDHVAATMMNDIIRATTPLMREAEASIAIDSGPGAMVTHSDQGSRYETMRPTEAEIAEFRKPREKPADAPHAPNAGVSPRNEGDGSPFLVFSQKDLDRIARKNYRSVWMRVDGKAKGQPRPCVTRSGHVFTPDANGELKKWKTAIRDAWRSAKCPQFIGPTHIEVTFIFARPKKMKCTGRRVWHTNKIDADNGLKCVMDALVEVGAVIDDKFFASVSARKFWAVDGESPGAEITIESLGEPE